MFYLIPRLNYKYTFNDALKSLEGLFKKSNNTTLLKKLFKTDEFFFVNHARTGIRIALSALDLPNDARIGVQAFNCQTVFNAISKAGFKPEFIDITDNFQIDTDDLKKKNKNIDAMIVTHLFGIPAEMDKVKEILEGIPIIEDCAHSFLSKYKERYTGTIGDIGVFSLGLTKFPSIGDGGLVVVNNLKYQNKISQEVTNLSPQSSFSEIKSILLSLFLSILHQPIIYGIFTFPIFKKVDNKQDFIGKYIHKEKRILNNVNFLLLKKVDELEQFKSKQRDNCSKIISLASKIVYIPPTISNDGKLNSGLNGFMLPVIVSPLRRDVLIERFRNYGIELGKHFSNSVIWAKRFGYQEGCCNNSEKIVDKIIVFPTHFKYPEYKLIENFNKMVKQ